MRITVQDDRENITDGSELTGKLKKIITEVCKKCLLKEAFKYKADVGILFTDNKGIRELNRKHRNIDKPTDVLSFPMQDIKKGVMASVPHEYDYTGGNILLGDVVVSIDKIREQAAKYGHSIERETAFLISHGVYHLLGYDHSTEDEEAEMAEKQEEVLAAMGLGRITSGEAGTDPQTDVTVKSGEKAGNIIDESTIHTLVVKAAAAKEYAYAPCSGFKVGAAILDENGRIHTGGNVENVSLGCTCCAERAAIYKAVSEGAVRIMAVAVASDSEDYIYPCGICRQVILEFACKGTQIICSRKNGRYRIFKASALMPHAFDGSSGLPSKKSKKDRTVK